MSRIHWPDLRNARDLGGLPTIHGGSTCERALVRTDNHGRLDRGGIQAIRAYGVSRIIDLRFAAEVAEHPSPFVGDERYRLMPACFDVADDEEIPTDSYRLMVDASRDLLAVVLAEIATAPTGGVVVHCHGGRDRTGVVVALVLHIVGVPVEAIAADYALTEGTSPSMITKTFAHLDHRYGGVIDYLIGCGVSSEHLAAIRDRLT